MYSKLNNMINIIYINSTNFKYSNVNIHVIGGVRTHACLCTTDLKSVPLDRSGTMT